HVLRGDPATARSAPEYAKLGDEGSGDRRLVRRERRLGPAPVRAAERLPEVRELPADRRQAPAVAHLGDGHVDAPLEGGERLVEAAEVQLRGRADTKRSDDPRKVSEDLELLRLLLRKHEEGAVDGGHCGEAI